jgi:predicted glycogen debranching enzyme
MVFRMAREECQNLGISSRKEWLLTNGIGGYAMGTPSGINTRRYHGLLIAATQPPATRVVLLAGLECHAIVDGEDHGLSCNQYPGSIYPEGYRLLDEFSVGAVAEWRYRANRLDVSRFLAMHPHENACTIRYRNNGKASVTLLLRPLVCHKPYHGNFYESREYPQSLAFPQDQTVVGHDGVSLYITHQDAFRAPVQGWYYRFEHQVEIERGLAPRDDLFCPCELRYSLKPGASVFIVASTQPDTAPFVFPKAEPAEEGSLTAKLQAAAEKFLVSTHQRTSIIAGYPWFTDWGRDTMISLPGICLHTGNWEAAKNILCDYAKQMRQGIIPNRFVEAGEQPEYNTVDATLWFVHALYRTLESRWDAALANKMLPVLAKIYDWHNRGTFYGIKVDPKDGLLTQGEEGVQLTWMDAKIDDWVVTPRHGKPVEINGLWINALRVMEWLAEKLQDPSVATYGEAADNAEANFDAKFWSERRGHYADTVDPGDVSLRPNQVIAMALPFGPAKGEHAHKALECVETELLTPRGLRTLGYTEPAYHGSYRGPLRELDAAYHQGTAWPWLLGPYISACVRVRGSASGLEVWKGRFEEMLTEGGLGGIAEVYDGDEPRSPAGCPWQAWSVAEILRVMNEELRE